MARRRLRILGATAALVLLATAAFAAPASAAAVVWVGNTYGSTCAYGRGGANTAHTVRLLEGSTPVTATVVTSDGSGYFFACFPSSYELVYGYRLEVKTTGYSRIAVIPNLAMKADRISDVVSGKAPAGKTIKISVTAYQPGHYVNATVTDVFVAANVTGDWSFDFTSHGGIRGQDILDLSYKPNQDYFGATGDVWRISLQVENMRIGRGTTHAWGQMNPGEQATLTLRSAVDAVRGRAYVAPDDDDGNYGGYFRTGAGGTVYPRATDKVAATFATDATMTVPNVTVAGNATSDVVSGICMPNQGFAVFARKPDYSDSATGYGVTSGSGAYAFDVTSQMNLVAGDYISVRCKFDTGDEVGREGVVL
jgi:hypothetical protein